MKRTLTLILAALLSVGALVPVATNLSEAAWRVVPKQKKVKKYSRAWWRLHRAKLRRKRALIARRNELLAQRQKNRNNVQMVPVVAREATVAKTVIAGWSGESVSGNGETKYRMNDAAGNHIGSAQLAVVGVAMSEPNGEVSAKVRNNSVGGVSTNSLRRAVIDRMIREDGWVVNDYQREVAGKKVFVVVAQTSKSGSLSSRLFYFTEVDGRIYSLATDAPDAYTEKVATDSEQFLEKLQQDNHRSDEVSAATSLQ